MYPADADCSIWRSVKFPQRGKKFADNSFVIITMNGTIKQLTERGFGFILQEGAEKDLFFHSSGLVDVNFDELKVGDNVSFDIEDSDKGPRATNVQRV